MSPADTLSGQRWTIPQGALDANAGADDGYLPPRLLPGAMMHDVDLVACRVV